MRRLSVAFVVQGEGRGHMTQALGLAAFLRDAGHQVDCVLVGRSRHRSIPKYFLDGIGAPVETFDAPIQVPGKQGRGLSIPGTVVDAALRLPGFVRAGRRIHAAVATADVVVNFLDLVTGVSRLFLRSSVPAVAVAHNYLFLHPELSQAPGGAIAKRFVRGWTRATAAGAGVPLALAFAPLGGSAAPHDPGRPYSNDSLPAPVRVVPPLLRADVGALQPTGGRFLLAYALNPGYSSLIAEWQRTRPDAEVHCYIDGGRASLKTEAGPGFHAHDLDDQAFLSHLSACRAYVGSAGFESICEAHFLGKPVLAVPTEGHLEQVWNAWDAERCGVARAGTYADLDDFWSNPGTPEPARVASFRRWVAQAPEVHVRAVEEAVSRSRL